MIKKSISLLTIFLIYSHNVFASRQEETCNSSNAIEVLNTFRKNIDSNKELYSAISAAGLISAGAGYGIFRNLSKKKQLELMAQATKTLQRENTRVAKSIELALKNELTPLSNELIQISKDTTAYATKIAGSFY